jgi:predicted permease
MSRLLGLAARLRLLFARRTAESRIDRELQFHIEMETERLIHELQIAPEEARRRVLATFGGVQQHRETLREGHGVAWLRGLSLDLKLGLRMLAKYPVLTLIGVFGLSIAVAVGTVGVTAVGALVSTTLPLDEGDRVVAVRNVDARTAMATNGTTFQDFVIWREALRSIEDLSAFRERARTLVLGDAPAEAVRIAEMTASAFRMARVAPIRGRHLTEDDERDPSANVVVIGYDLWQRTLGGRDDIVGSTVLFGPTRYTVIGVMPRGFAFPMNEQAWMPLRLDAQVARAGTAPAVPTVPTVSVFGRLAPGASLDDAQRELTVIGQRLAVSDPRGHEHIRARVLPYTRQTIDLVRFAGSSFSQLLFLGEMVVTLLLVVVATNVAIIVYTRTTSRAGEIAVRTALGASRPRIVAQLFAEALVLSTAASAVGVAIAHVLLQQANALIVQEVGALPYWINLNLTPRVAGYVAGLVVLSAVIIGVIPGLKATASQISDNLKDLTGGTSMRLGRTWTTLLVAQVAVSVTALPIAVAGSQYVAMTLATSSSGTSVTKTFVVATPLLDAPNGLLERRERSSEHQSLYLSKVERITQELRAMPGADVIRVSSMPGGDAGMNIDVARLSTDTAATAQGRYVAATSVDAQFFAAFEMRLLSGRTFRPGDFGPTTIAVVVNRAFVDRFLKGQVALGRRIRPTPDTTKAAEGWWEIVGVVEDFRTPDGESQIRSRVYLPMSPSGTYPMTLAVRARGLPPVEISDRIRRAVVAVDPALRLPPTRTLEEELIEKGKLEGLGILGLWLLTLSVVLLSAAGIYALMSFTVARRQREIGIRSALGAPRARILSGVLSRAMLQIGVGILIGTIGTGVLWPLSGDSVSMAELSVKLLGVAALMVTIGFLASLGPASRALRVPPTEVLRVD